MKNNRGIALGYRAVAFLLCLAGILETLGVFRGAVWWTGLLYYTVQSNILVLLMLGALLVKTALAVRRDGLNGSSSFFERLSAIITLAITVTFVLYWALLAPLMMGPGLIAFGNLQVHGITPLLMLIDYFMFTKPGKLKKYDPLLFAAVPLAYFIQATIIGFTSSKPLFFGSRFPYFFIDFDQIGAGVFIYVGVITVVFLAAAFFVVKSDERRGGK
ncbi:MAG: Pr6Pr family membrane protein [Oscillospiraceae bacterium]|jgi:hypothetical protein|nr:Pr6Pr family membrane protein [Oscillospiraceae bacterium]